MDPQSIETAVAQSEDEQRSSVRQAEISTTSFSDNVGQASQQDEVKPLVVEKTPRKPGTLPAGASLAERIAALQKSSSGSQRGSSSSNGRAADRSVSSFSGAAERSNRDIQQSRSISSGSKSAAGLTGSAAVKDRIARFQGAEAPLLPKSSFGSPSPMTGERNSNALRPYPGANATGGGTGSWGEGVLRPQMTGGTWTGAGEGRGWQSIDAGHVRPQFTGTPWTGAGTSSPLVGRYKAGSTSSNGSASKSPLRNRDAFLDLDEDSSLLSVSPQKARLGPRRESSFSDAQLAAASMGLSRSPKPQTTDDGTDSVGDHASSVAGSREGNETMSNATTLADLPEAPTEKPTQLSSLPNAPSTAPIVRSPVMSQMPIPSNDVEISVGNATPEKMEKLRRTASGRHDELLTAKDTSQHRSALLSEIQARGKSPKQPSLALDDDGASDIGRLIISSSATDDGSAVDSPLISAAQSLPTVEEAPRRIDVPSSEVQSAHDSPPLSAASMSNGQHVESTAVHERKRTLSNESGVVDPIAAATQPIVTIPSSSSSQMAPSLSSASSVTKQSPDHGRSAAAAESASLVKSQSEGLNELQSASAHAANQAKQAILAARSKSQSIKKPPPGRMMTAAEMDASDDEYEPGWASVTKVFSSSRQT